MNLLVIGGTRFVGKHIVIQAVASGHQVTLFNRGSLPAPDGVAQVITGDRNTDIEQLASGNWDAVVDTSAYFPRQVHEAARVLRDRCRHYTLISSISAYADQTAAGLDEDS